MEKTESIGMTGCGIDGIYKNDGIYRHGVVYGS